MYNCGAFFGSRGRGDLSLDETVIMLSVLSRDRNVFTGSNFNIELQQ